jgi:hypothetical protein
MIDQFPGQLSSVIPDPSKVKDPLLEFLIEKPPGFESRPRASKSQNPLKLLGKRSFSGDVNHFAEPDAGKI